MKRLLFSSLAGGLILFFWQFLSFAAVNLHRSAQQYTPHQDEILAKLAELDLEEGMYHWAIHLGRGCRLQWPIG